MPKFTPLHLHSHYSLLDGLSKPEQIAQVCANYGYGACAITDHGSLSGAIDFVQALEEKNIKPILGCELYVNRNDARVQSKENGPRQTDHLVVLAKNLAGWKTLVKIVSRANDEDVYYYKPRVDLSILKEMVDGNLISFSGHCGSLLANCMFHDYNSFDGKLCQDPPVSIAKATAEAWANKYQDVFGKGNFFLEVQLIDKDHTPNAKLIADVLREVSKSTGIPCVATADSHYPNREDAVDQRVLICGQLKTTFSKVNDSLENGEDVGLGGFFKSNSFHIPSPDEIRALNTPEEIANTELIASMCESYSLGREPDLPNFPTPGDISQDEYLTQLCREGWVNILQKRGILKDDKTKEIYTERVKSELGILQGAGLSGYFLIIQDFINWSRKQGWLVGPGRGSAAGSLVSYLSRITLVDPIPNDLLFSRFYNAGRNKPGHVEFPDIDVDVPVDHREEIINYLRGKYGHKHVAQLATFGRLQGRNAIQEVLRVHGACGFDQMKKITAGIPDESRIADKLEEDKEDSVIRWILENEPENVSDYCRLEDDGSLSGEYAMYFQQAIRLEGTYKSCGKHAAGVVIGSQELNNVCPMIRATKGEDKIAGWSMNDCAYAGLIKMDVLGIAILDKLMFVNDLLKGK